MHEDDPAGTLRLDTQLSALDRDFLGDQINTFNLAQTGIHDYQELGFVLRDAAETIIAGVAGFSWGGACEIRSLWVHDAWRGRGLGLRLLRMAEKEAAARGCAVVVLDTHSFQAPEFYRKHGYAVAGIVDGYPAGHQKYYFQKRLG